MGEVIVITRIILRTQPCKSCYSIALGPDDEVKRVSPERGSSLLSIFIGVVVAVFIILVVCVLAYTKRQKIRWYYNEYKMKRDARKAE